MAMTDRLGESASAQRPRHARERPGGSLGRQVSHHSPCRNAAHVQPSSPAGYDRQRPAHAPAQQARNGEPR